MYNQQMSKCALKLEAIVSSKRLEDPVQAVQILTVIHSFGINFRQLGYLRTCVNDKFLKQMLLTEMVARSTLHFKDSLVTNDRAMKEELRARLRNTIEQVKVSSEVPFTTCIVNFFNLLLGNSGVDSEEFWEVTLRNILKEKYSVGLTSQ